MLFCKNLVGTLSPRCGGILTTMADKSPRSKSSNSEPAAEKATAPVAVAEAPPAAPRKIYNIVKYGDPVLEKNTATITKFDAELAELAEDMFASMYAAQGVGLAAPQIGKGLRIAVV